MRTRSNKTFRKSNNYYNKSKEEYGDIQYHVTGKPESEGKVADLISIKALRFLPKSSYSVQADPYTAALPGSEPYPIINAFNRTIGGNYGGLKNIDGGNIQQYANSVRSKMLHAFDFMRLKLGFNYQFLPVRGSDAQYSKDLINEQIKAIDEATSTLKSTTFTQMAIYDYAIRTDMAMGDAKTYKVKVGASDTSTTEVDLYTDLSDVIYASTRFYQIFLLKVLSAFDWHNSFRVKMGTMIRSSWNRETARLNGFFGLMKKKSFLALWNSLALSFPGEYVDTQFATQFTRTCLIPSRRSNSLLDPVLEVEPIYNMPKIFTMYIKVSDTRYEKLWDAEEFLKETTNAGEITFDEAIENLFDLLSAESTMQWARNSEAVGDSPESDAKRFNTIRNNLGVLQTCMTSFKKYFTDIREVLDTVSRTGIIRWTKGFRPSVTKDDDAALFRNLIVDDIFRLSCSGPKTVKLDSATKRFRTWTMWHMYDGIPEFDIWSGGSFLTFSLKEIDGAEDPDKIQNFIPQALTKPEEGVKVYACNRLGTQYVLDTVDIQLSKFIGTCRLVPLTSQDDEVATMLNITAAGSPSVDEGIDYSFLSNTLVKVLGMCVVTVGTERIIYQDPDVISIYQIEIEDITNEMIAFARKTGPFLGSVNSMSSIGFLGTSSRTDSKTAKDKSEHSKVE